MQERHLNVVRSLPRSEKRQVRRALSLPPRGELISLVSKMHQADLVVALLRCEYLVPAVRLVGRPISLFPPAKGLRLAAPPPIAALGPDDRRVLRAARNPRLPTTPAFQRFRLLKPGVSIREFLSRGGKRRDIRYALRHGYKLSRLPSKRRRTS
jgi:hypothetical protein